MKYGDYWVYTCWDTGIERDNSVTGKTEICNGYYYQAFEDPDYSKQVDDFCLAIGYEITEDSGEALDKGICEYLGVTLEEQNEADDNDMLLTESAVQSTICFANTQNCCSETERLGSMIIQAELECKCPDFRMQACSVEKVVELSQSEFAEFIAKPLEYYDFIRDFNKEDHPIRNDTRSCLLVLGEQENDGVLIDPQGYDYARYSAYVPNARNLVQREQYPSLNSFADEMRRLADEYVKKAVSDQIDCQYSIDLNAIERQCRHSGFSEELFTDMLSDRPEIEAAETMDGYCTVTIAEPYLRQDDEQNLRKPTSEEVEIMCAKHFLWLHDAGGEQADFSNCLLADLDLSRKNLINAVLDGAKLQNVKLQNAELCFASCIGTKFYHCDLTDVIAEEADLKNAECIGSDFDNACFTHSNFSNTKFCDCSMNDCDLKSCCLDKADFGEMYLGSTNTRNCCFDEQAWIAEQDGQNMSM